MSVDEFGGIATFTVHVDSLSGTVFFQASSSTATLLCMGTFIGNIFSGNWTLQEPDGDTSDTGGGG